jgi:RHS repeat-associated protein
MMLRIILKNVLTIMALVFGLNICHSQLTDSENYVYTKTHLSAPGETVKSSEVVTYIDGLGRPKQTISVKGGGDLSKDLVTPIIYDDYGRQRIDVLPIPISTSDNAIHNGITETSGQSFYQDNIPFAEKKLEQSPLNRIRKQIQPGSDWQDHPSEFDYQANDGEDVLRFSTTTSLSGTTLYSSILTVNGFYAASKLYKNRISDEDGKITYEFRNGQGQVLLVRKVRAEGRPGSRSTFEYLDTYYVYNDYNQLVFVIPPLAAQEFRNNNIQNILNPRDGNNGLITNLCYQYIFDNKNRLAEKKLPGKGWEYLIYDKADRIIMSQDSKLATNNNTFGSRGWLFTKYDKFNRVVYTGFTSNNDDRATIQAAIDISVGNIFHESRSSAIIINSGTNLYYSNITFPTTLTKILSVNYYDTYPTGTIYPSNNSIQGEPILLAAYDGLGRSTKSLPLATMVKNINDDKWTKTYTYYDGKGRVIGTTNINHLNGKTKVELKLEFAGVVKHSETWHNKKSGEQPIHIIEDFFYDHQNRLTKHYHEVEGKSPKELLTDNTYDALGRLNTKKVGARSDANLAELLPALQTIKYHYNIRGWNSGINLLSDGTLDTSKLFSCKIKYNDTDNTTIKNYNGNISEVDWTYGLTTNSRYEYTYDTLNRLKAGNYKTFNETTTTDSKFFNEEVSYDLNGNISHLIRNARPRTGLTANLVDDLSYSYESNELSNRISKIYDDTQNNSGYPAVMIPQPITYDDNGNMLTIPDKGITTPIIYNYLNLPQAITKNTQPVTYTYRADGVKVHKSFEVNGQNIQTWYLDGFVYTTPYTPDIVIALEKTPEAEDMSVAGQRESFELAEKVIVDPGGPGEPMVQSKPDFFATAEGFYDFNTFRYIYQYKDHLGNTRLNFARDENNLLYSEDRNDYYPFGLNFINPVSFGPAQFYNPSATYKNYKYNGKELQETGMYDYGARFYMPDIGRWGVVDPLAETTPSWSPYTYGFNNPVRFIDPTGMANEDFVQRKDGSIYWDNKANDQATTKSGDTYLGKNLSLTFNSYIGDNYDGPLGSLPEGDKLTTTINLSASENDAGELTGLSATKTTEMGKTFGMFEGRDFYPGEGGSNNSFTKSGMSINYEQHASVPSFEESGLNSMGFKIVDVSQKLNISFDKKSGNLSVNAYTNIFPSATLKLNNTGTTLMNYKQPSFVGTHTAPTINNAVMGRGGVELPAKDFSYYPAKFYKRN